MASKAIIGIDTHIVNCNYFCMEKQTGVECALSTVFFS